MYSIGFCHGLQNIFSFFFVTDLNSHRFRYIFICVQSQGRKAKRLLSNFITNAGFIESSMVSALTVGKDRFHLGDTSKQRENFV